MAFGNVGGDTSYYTAAPAAGGYKHGDRLPDESNYIDPNINVADYNASKGWGGMTGEINSGVYTANSLAPAQYQNPDMSWVGGNTGAFGIGGTAPGNPYGAVMRPGAAPAGGPNWGALPINEDGSRKPVTGTPMQGFGTMNAPGGYGTTTSGAPGQRNPYLSGMADEIGRRTQQGLGQAFNQIRSNAVGNGGLGGSRQGVAQGQAIGNAMDSYQGNLANLYGSSYQFDQGQDTTRRGQDDNFYTANRQLDQSGQQLGANMLNLGNQGEWGGLNNASNIYNNFTGYGTQAQKQSTGWQDVLGGGLAAYQLWNNLYGGK